ncbi:MAG: tetratricopeptide repeat protein [Xanthomonadales bacterium]|nr:tetratricopeptide repeat protein [Xanthomonadales bacterium]
MPLIRELQKRNVFRVAAAYLVSAWLIIQVAETIFPLFGFGDTPARVVVIVLAVLFIPALILAWVFEWTPEGLQRESQLDHDRPAQRDAQKRLDRIIITVLVVALAYFAMDKFVLAPQREAAIVEQALEAAREEGNLPTAQEIPEQSIAVLPFVNLSSDPEQEYFSDGLTEELLNLLAGVEDLKVSARTSSFYYKDKRDEIPFMEIGRQLGVAYLLEGSVRRGGDQVRITAQLIKAEDGFHLWSQTFDRTLDDVFAIQDEISAAVVDSLKVTILGDGPHANVVDPRSWELAMEARFYYNRRAEGDLEKAVDLFEQALELDPDNVTALVGLAPLYFRLFDGTRRPDAERVVNRALELEPNNPQALVRKSSIMAGLGRTDEAMEAWRLAVKHGRGSSLVYATTAGTQYRFGYLGAAVRMQRKAVSLDPLNPGNVGNLAAYLMRASQFEEAERWLLKASELSPMNTARVSNLAQVHLLLNDLDAAKQWLQAYEAAQDMEMHVSLPGERQLLRAMLSHSQGRTELAEQQLKQYRDEGRGGCTVCMAYLHAWRGELEEAWTWIEETREIDGDRWFVLGYLLEPWLEPLHADPRWEAEIEHYRSLIPEAYLEGARYAREVLLN